jgi:hypothetical protein
MSRVIPTYTENNKGDCLLTVARTLALVANKGSLAHIVGAYELKLTLGGLSGALFFTVSGSLI